MVVGFCDFFWVNFSGLFFSSLSCLSFSVVSFNTSKPSLTLIPISSYKSLSPLRLTVEYSILKAMIKYKIRQNATISKFISYP